LAKDAETVNAVWRVLAVSLDLLGETREAGGTIGAGQVTKSVAKKTVATAQLAGTQGSAQGIQMATFVGGVMLTSVEMSLETAKMTNPAKAGI
jgi:hypothetical protein